MKLKNTKVDFDSKVIKSHNNYKIIQFNHNPSKLEIKKLKDEGINVLEYLGSNSYYVKIKLNSR